MLVGEMLMQVVFVLKKMGSEGTDRGIGLAERREPFGKG